MPLILPKEVSIQCQDGTEKAFIISKFPAVAGREIVAGYPLGLVQFGEYRKVSESVMLLLMQHVAVPSEDETRAPLQLKTRALIDNHVPDWEALARLEFAMLEYNTSFFTNGAASTALKGFVPRVIEYLTPILTGLSAAYSKAGAPPSANSEPSTP